MHKQLSKEEAIKLTHSNWWNNCTPETIAWFQMTQDRLCLPFDVFHKSIETLLGRSVWTHEFADPNALIMEAIGQRQFEGAIESMHRVAPNLPIIPIVVGEQGEQ